MSSDTRKETSVQLAYASAMVAGTLVLLPAVALAAPGESHMDGFKQFKLDNPQSTRRDFRREFRAQRDLFGGAQFQLNTNSNKNGGALGNLNGGGNPGVNTRVMRADRLANKSFQTTDAGKLLQLHEGVDIDLSSVQQNITLGDKLFKNTESVTIESGGVMKTLSAGAKVTAAEYVACKQVLLSGKQSVQLDAAGRAIGGQVDLSAITARNEHMRVDDLYIPTNLVTYGDFSKRSTFQITGDLVNAGSLYAYSSGNVNKGTLKADNITNEEGALISTNLTDALAQEHGGSQSPVDLQLIAEHSLTNHGVIESSGDLTITAGESINNTPGAGGQQPLLKAQNNVTINAPHVVNGGLIQAVAGNISVDTLVPSDLVVDNQGGVMSALNGAINLRTPDYNGTFNTFVTGGDLLSKTLNANSGQGTADITVDELTGTVNETGLASHISAETEVLNLGKICLTGDPTYKNANGSIVFTGDITVGEALTVIASQDIYNTKALTITAGNGTTGFPITLIAGAEITSGGTDTTSLPPTPGGTATTISGKASATGGNINLSSLGGGAVTINARSTGGGNANGADIFLVAYNTPMNGKAGLVTLTGSSLNSGGRGTGNNGNIEILSDGRDSVNFDAIQTGNMNTTGGSGTGGDIRIICIKPKTTTGMEVVYNANGTLSGTEQIVIGTVLQNNASVRVDGNITANNLIRIACGGGGQDLIDVRDGVLIKTVAPDGVVQLHNSFSSDVKQSTKSFISTNTLELSTLDGDMGSAANPITSDAKFISIAGDSFETEVFLKSTAPNVFLKGDTLSINVVADGNICTQDGFQLLAANLNLVSLKGGIGLTAQNAFEGNALNLTLVSKTDTFFHNNYNGTTTLYGQNTAVGTFNLHSDGNMDNAAGASIAAKVVDLKTDGSFGNAFNPTITALTSIALTSVGDITNATVDTTNMKAPLMVLTSSGNIGTSAAGRFTLGANIAGVKATADNVYLLSASLAKKGFNLAGGNAMDFDFVGAGKLNITGNVNAGAGSDLSIRTAKGSITVKPGLSLTAGRNMLLRVFDTSSTASKSKIIIGKDVTLQTNAAATFGDITLSIGTVVAPIVGQAPASGVSYAENGGTVYFGAGGLSAKSPVNTLYAKGADIIINNGFTTKNISLGGNVKIIADPPVTNSDVTWITPEKNHVPAGLANGLLSVNQNADLAQLNSVNQALPLVSNETPIAFNSDVISMIATNSARFNSQQPFALGAANLDDTVSTERKTGEPATLLNSLEDNSVITTYGAKSGLVESTLVAEETITRGLQSNQKSLHPQAAMNLESGHSVFVAAGNTELTTSFGKVCLQPGAVVLLSHNANGLSVYNVHDEKKNSVAIETAGRRFMLAPGQHLTIAHGHAGDFASVNAVEAIAHRTLNQQMLNQDLSVFTSEFSVSSALDCVSSLKSITSSANPEVTKLRNKIVKTAAVLMYIGGSLGDFQQYIKPQVTALNPRI